MTTYDHHKQRTEDAIVETRNMEMRWMVAALGDTRIDPFTRLHMGTVGFKRMLRRYEMVQEIASWRLSDN